MLRLILYRHAKSSWADPRLDDHDRPLAKRGLRDAPRMGRAIADRGYVPQRILCSTALRARQTLELSLAEMIASQPMKPAVRYDGDLYEVGAGRIHGLIEATPSTIADLMVVGHNPGLETLAHLLVHDGEAEARKNMATKFPTAAIAVLEFDCRAWTDIAQCGGRLIDFTVPKRLI